MTDEQWATMRNFKPGEFDSHDAPGSGKGMDYEFVHRLDLLRERFGRPILIVSGMRTAEHNEDVGGVPDSAHTHGLAADISCMDSVSRMKMLSIAVTLFRRIGIGKSFIHVDLDPTKPQDVAWLYP